MWGGFFSRYVHLGEESDIIPQDLLYISAINEVAQVWRRFVPVAEEDLAIYFFSCAVDVI